jgi:hypothetical protein
VYKDNRLAAAQHFVMNQVVPYSRNAHAPITISALKPV